MTEKKINPMLEKYYAEKAEKEAEKVKYVKKEVSFDEKNYLNTRLEKDEQKKEITIRLIPIEPESNLFWVKRSSHWVPGAGKNGKGQGYTCPKNSDNLPEGTNKECPFCDASAEAEIEQKKLWYADKKVESKKMQDISYANRALGGNIARVIDRADEDFGPKFWSFSDVHEAAIIMEMEKYFTKKKIDITDLKEGFDLVLNIEAELDKTGKKVSKIKRISVDFDQTPLSEDEKLVEKWVNDSKKWYDVFVVKPYEYLELIQAGKEPWFDKPSNKWVDKAEFHKVKEEETDNEESDIDDSEFVNKNSFTNKKEEETDLPF